MTDLTDAQLEGVKKIEQWHHYARTGQVDPVFALFGYAGTGKTFTAARVADVLGLRNVVFGTYTGKAAHVLRGALTRYGDELGLPAPMVSTIHSAIYYPTSSAEARRAYDDAIAELEGLRGSVLNPEPSALDTAAGLNEAADRIKALEASLPELLAATKRVAWEWNPDSEWASADLIVLDEVSMVNEKLARDIEAYGVPVLVLGDPAQLPPVEGGGYYTEREPGHLLTEIQRQALDNPITGLAHRVRSSTGPALGLERGELRPASIREAMEFDQVLCWSNKRRWALIEAIRKLHGRAPDVPVAGDRIMCLTNNKELAVFNGQQFEVIGATPGTLGPTLAVRDLDGGTERAIPVFSDGFMGREIQDQAKRSGAGMRGGRMLATFAQAITVHKAQGSEWGSVYVANETPGMISMTARREGHEAALEQARRWLYTAVTRAKETLVITAPARR